VTKLEEIEAAIAKLTAEEFERLGEWIDRRRETKLDRRIEADARSGRLDALHDRLRAENPGEDISLDEFLGRTKLP
jgi:hypothetical protein